MIDETRIRLEAAIERELETLKGTSPDSEEYQDTIKNLEVLYRLKIDEDSIANDKRRGRMDYIRYVLELLGIIVPVWSYGRWVRMCFKFEETGSIMSTGGRQISRLFSPKRIKIR